MMNMRLQQLMKIFFAIFLSLTGAASALANSGAAGPQREDKQALRAARQAQKEDRRAARQSQQEAIAPGQPAAEPAKKNGRLTREERRDLRRQINEAGQGIYNTPKP